MNARCTVMLDTHKTRKTTSIVEQAHLYWQQRAPGSRRAPSASSSPPARPVIHCACHPLQSSGLWRRRALGTGARARQVQRGPSASLLCKGMTRERGRSGEGPLLGPRVPLAQRSAAVVPSSHIPPPHLQQNAVTTWTACRTRTLPIKQYESLHRDAESQVQTRMSAPKGSWHGMQHGGVHTGG